MTGRRARRALDRIVGATSIDELLACPTAVRTDLYEVLLQLQAPSAGWRRVAATVARRRSVTTAYVVDRAMAVLATLDARQRHDLYALFGVDPGATADDIRLRWRTLAKRHHPDHGPTDALLFRRFQEAYAILSDPVQRMRYEDAWRRQHGPAVARITAGARGAGRRRRGESRSRAGLGRLRAWSRAVGGWAGGVLRVAAVGAALLALVRLGRLVPLLRTAPPAPAAMPAVAEPVVPPPVVPVQSPEPVAAEATVAEPEPSPVTAATEPSPEVVAEAESGAMLDPVPPEPAPIEAAAPVVTEIEAPVVAEAPAPVEVAAVPPVVEVEAPIAPIAADAPATADVASPVAPVVAEAPAPVEIAAAPPAIEVAALLEPMIAEGPATIDVVSPPEAIVTATPGSRVEVVAAGTKTVTPAAVAKPVRPVEATTAAARAPGAPPTVTPAARAGTSVQLVVQASVPVTGPILQLAAASALPSAPASPPATDAVPFVAAPRLRDHARVAAHRRLRAHAKHAKKARRHKKGDKRSRIAAARKPPAHARPLRPAPAHATLPRPTPVRPVSTPGRAASPPRPVSTPPRPAPPPRRPAAKVTSAPPAMAMALTAPEPIDLQSAQGFVSEFARRYSAHEAMGLLEMFATGATADGRQGVAIADGFGATFRRLGDVRLTPARVELEPMPAGATVRADYELNVPGRAPVHGRAQWVLVRVGSALRATQLRSSTTGGR